MALTDVAVRGLQARDVVYKKADGAGLYIEVHPTGAKYWRLKYRYAGKERRLAIGVYPSVSLADARKQVQAAKSLLERGLDPTTEKRIAKARNVALTTQSFRSLVEEWLSRGSRSRWSDSYSDKVATVLNANVLSRLGEMPLTSITAPMVVEAVHAIEARGAMEQAARALRWVKGAFRYAVATGRIDRSPLADVMGSDVLAGRESKGYAHLQLEEIGPFLRALNEYPGRPETAIAVRMLLLTAVRTGELRGATWQEFDIPKSLWRIPADRMKSRREHVVPLSNQLLQLLDGLRGLTGHSTYLFPGTGKRTPYISENTINKAIALVGFKGRVVGHGFRATFSSIANESGLFQPDVIERQLAHKERDEVRAAYHRSTYIDDRKRLMQWWADRLDGVDNAPDSVRAEVVPIHSAA